MSSGQSLVGAYASEVDDTLLVREAQNGNTKAFEELARHYDKAVLQLALRLTGSREGAQEVYQDAFLRAYRNLPHFRFECSFYTWLYRIVVDRCLDCLRRNHLQQSDVNVKTPTDGVDAQRETQIPANNGMHAERSSNRHEVRERFGRALSQLSARERIVFELKHYQGLKLSTVATLLDTTESTIKSTLLRATEKLRLELSELQ